MISFNGRINKFNNRVIHHQNYTKPSDISGLMFETDGFDRSTMFQNVEGTIPVLNNGDPVRRINAGDYYFANPSNEWTGGVYENNVLTFYNANPGNVFSNGLLIYPIIQGILTDGVSPYTLFALDSLQVSGSQNYSVSRPFLYLSQSGTNANMDGFRMCYDNIGIPQYGISGIKFRGDNVSYHLPFYSAVRFIPAGRVWSTWQNGIKGEEATQTFTPFTTTSRFRIIYQRSDTLPVYRKHYKLLLYNRALSDEEVMLVNNYLGIIRNSHL